VGFEPTEPSEDAKNLNHPRLGSPRSQRERGAGSNPVPIVEILYVRGRLNRGARLESVRAGRPPPVDTAYASLRPVIPSYFMFPYMALSAITGMLLMTSVETS